MRNDISQGEPIPSRVRISFKKGILEVEGREEFVLGIYRDFRENSGKSGALASEPEVEGAARKEVSPKSDQKPRKTKGQSNEPYIVKNLDLAAKNGFASLREHYAGYSPKTNLEHNLIFVAYLQEVLEEESVTASHVFTCYAEVGVKAPKAFRQSLYDTSKKGWLNTESLNDMQTSRVGLSYLEHDMPRAE